MPGLLGLFQNENIESSLERMQSSMMNYEHFIAGNKFIVANLAMSFVHAGCLQTGNFFYNEGDYIISVDGESYNFTQVAETMGMKASSLEELLSACDQVDELDSCLSRLDGYFSAVIFDQKRQKLKIVSDRHGHRPIYYCQQENLFAWASEVKAILAIPELEKNFDADIIECFLRVGHLVGQRTFFKDIKLLKPASVLELDLLDGSILERHYWSWSKIKPQSVTFDTAVDLLGEAFISAVEKHFDPKEKIGVALSGGLDSRAILAAVTKLYPDYEGYAYTFGIPNCPDVTIAQEVMRATPGWKHDIFYFEDKDWFEPRKDMVWNTDGMKDIMHMHGAEFLQQISNHIDINLNGYLGDAILGGSYLKNTARLDTRIDRSISVAAYGGYAEDVESSFFDIQHYDNYLFANRGRRFVNVGTINALPWVAQRKPFFDNDLVELIFSLPDHYRSNNRLYSTMLKKFFPKYFRTIAWQQTGKPASQVAPRSFTQKAFGRIDKLARQFFDLSPASNYTNYPKWIREPEVSFELRDLLCRDGSFYSTFTTRDFEKEFLNPHLRSRFVDRSDSILRAATLEVYLRKINEKFCFPN